MNKLVSSSLVAAALACGAAHADVVLYSQDFEHPVNFVDDGQDVNIFRTVNDLYANQPAGFQFAQAFTVETLLIGGSGAWNVAGNPGGGFKDPQGIGGTHAISMLSSTQNDLLGLSFNVGAFGFLNFKLDISSIDLNNFGGPFFDGKAPSFLLSLYDNPTGAIGLGGGTLLSSATITGALAASQWTFDWTSHVVGLSTAGNTNGNVTLRIDELQGGYAALDNFVIAASDTAGQIPAVPEPETYALMLGGLAVVSALTHRRRRRG